MDSVKTIYSQVLLVDNGGFFPEQDVHQDAAWFLMDAMKVLGTDAVGLGERDLRFGLAYLRGQIKRTGLPMICSNLIETEKRKPALTPYLVKKVGGVKVGFFGLLSDKANLGPAQDSLSVSDPTTVAKEVVSELRKKGATVVVLLSQLGKVDGEDLANAVDGIDAIVMGHNIPMIRNGRMIKNTVACYGGEQGQYICSTEITLDAQHRMATADAAAIVLGPEVPDKDGVAKLVKSFEDGVNEKIRKAEKEREVQKRSQSVESSPDHFLGSEVCIRCHQNEGKQWLTTAHSAAWQTLVEAEKQTASECVSCHVLGYQQPGGFVSEADTPHLTNVQCESCHGMGTRHEAFAASPHRVTEQTCRGCHTAEQDPGFNWAMALPKISHDNFSGETLRASKENAGRKSSMMNSH